MIETTIVCPFCPLACDDVRVDQAGMLGQLPTVQTTCKLAAKRLQEALRPAQLRIANKAASLDEIRQHLNELASQAKRIVVKTSGVDLASAKTLEQLDSSGKINWLLDQSLLTQSWQRTSSRDGVISATLGDVREHADLLWLIGDVEASTPRMKEMLTRNKPDLRVIETPGPLNLDALASLSLATRNPDTTHAVQSIAELAAAIESSKYFAVVLGDDAFTTEFADAALSLLIQWTWSLNATRRAVALHLDDAATNRAVYRWRTNRSLGNIDENGSAAKALTIRIGERAVDHSRVDVAIGTRDPGIEQANVFVPCSVIGIHETGARIRGDGTVTVPLAKIAESDLPSAVAWISSLIRPCYTSN